MISNFFLQCHFAKQCYFAHFGCKKSARISKNTIHHRGIYSASHAWTFHTRLLTLIPSKSINYCKNKISILFLNRVLLLEFEYKSFFFLKIISMVSIICWVEFCFISCYIVKFDLKDGALLEFVCVWFKLISSC